MKLTRDELKAILVRNPDLQAINPAISAAIGGAASSAKPQPAVRDEPLAKAQGAQCHPPRCHVRVTSHRKRLIDPDNLCPKYFIDGLRYAGVIVDDTAKDITIEVKQTKDHEEYTEIEIFDTASGA